MYNITVLCDEQSLEARETISDNNVQLFWFYMHFIFYLFSKI